MMPVKLSPSSLNETRWHEYLVRFVLDGAVTVLTGAIARHFGSSVGGLFLALPAIFCASATLIERHKRCAKEKAGLSGDRQRQQAAALDAAGAALGSVGLMTFAAVFFLIVSKSVTAAFVAALLAWASVAVGA